ELIIQLAAEEHAEVVGRQLEIELGDTGSLPSDVGVSGINLLPFQSIDSPFVAGGDFVGLRGVRRRVLMGGLAFEVTDLKLIGFDQRRAIHSIPVGESLVMLGGFVLAAMFETDGGVPTERHQIREKKSICGLD